LRVVGDRPSTTGLEAPSPRSRVDGQRTLVTFVGPPGPQGEVSRSSQPKLRSNFGLTLARWRSVLSLTSHSFFFNRCRKNLPSEKRRERSEHQTPPLQSLTKRKVTKDHAILLSFWNRMPVFRVLLSFSEIGVEVVFGPAFRAGDNGGSTQELIPGPRPSHYPKNEDVTTIPQTSHALQDFRQDLKDPQRAGDGTSITSGVSM